MPRKPRIEAPGLIYHVIGRGVERRDIFADEQDRESFLTRLGKALMDTHTGCLAFCLMPNHFHLLLKSGQVPISTPMRRLLTGYAVYFNKRHLRVGHLFQNRYKSIICQEDAYLLELIRYIHLNSIRAGLCSSLDELKRSALTGHSAILRTAKYDWYPPEPPLAHFGRSETSARRIYLEFMKDGISLKTNPIFSGGGLKRSLGYPSVYPKERQAFDERILGDSHFVLRLQELEEIDHTGENKGTMQNLIDSAANERGLETAEVTGKAATRELIETRSIIAYLAVRYLGLSYADVGRYLHIHRSTAARMVQRGKGFAKDMDVKKWLGT